MRISLRMVETRDTSNQFPIAMLDEAVKILLEGQNRDGGWGAVSGSKSQTEVTALAMLALKSVGRSDADFAAERAEKWLLDRQNGDGSWPLGDGFKGASWATALAMIALGEAKAARERLINAGNWALEQQGSTLPILARLVMLVTFQKNVVQLNRDLVGWSWTQGSASWVEPTSYFLIALKRLKADLSGKLFAERIRQGELMVYDRMCQNGGWNYGNSLVYGDPLSPYPDITAVALLALQDHRERRENQLSLSVLEKMARATDSGLALGWSAIALSVYGRDSAELKRRLAERFRRTRFLGEHKAIALGILALTQGAEYFRFAQSS
ncbi:MAG TPA: prenyltransferase/squalene oxidase repeat-containing protein [Candidatus Binatia bacterium]|nr:prenyltransferase/squalene oxidase repeat-containing protein [Candidatus Binatia bacterium]